MVSVSAVLVLVFLSGQAFVGATRVGISTDEPVHQSRMNQWFETGWYLPARFLDDGAPRAEIETGRLHAYGAGYSIFGHAVASLIGAEQWGATERTASAYAARGIAVALLGLSAAMAVGYALLVMTGRWVVGLWGAASVFALPLWTGYSMFAVKDVPAAAGWTFVTAALVVGLTPRPGWQRPLAVGLLSFVGVWFSVGVRTALWVPIVASVVTFGMLAAASLMRSELAANVVAAASGLTSGFAAVAALQYRNAATPITWLLSAVEVSGESHWTGATLTAGQLVSEKPPWWYLPAWTAASVPVLLGLMTMAGIILIAASLGRGHACTGLVRARLGQKHSSVLLWVQQALLLPSVATIGGATMYAGLRQHLYILPALAALAGFASDRVVATSHGHWGRASMTFLVAAIVIPAGEQTQLFPYNFVYKNITAGSVDDRWETDMHWVSAREAISRIPRGVDVWCYTQSTQLLSGEVRRPRLSGCMSHRQVRPFIAEQGGAYADTVSVAIDADGEMWAIGRKYRGSPPAPQCVERDNVSRQLRWDDVVIGYVLVCPRALYGGQ